MRICVKVLLLSLILTQIKSFAKYNETLFWSYLSYQIDEENTECRKTYMTRIFKLTTNMSQLAVMNELNMALGQHGFERVKEERMKLHRFRTFDEANAAWRVQLKLENKEAKKSDYKVFCDPQVLEWTYQSGSQAALAKTGQVGNNRNTSTK